MTDNELDDIFKKRLQQYEGEIPADMWQRINTGKKKRRGGYIWLYLVAAIVLVIFTTGIYHFYTGTGKKEKDANSIVITGKEKKTDSFNETGTATKTNEAISNKKISSADKNITALTALSKKITKYEKHHDLKPVNKQIDESISYPSSSKNNNERLNDMESSNPEISDHAITDAINKKPPGEPANENIAENSNDDSLAQDEEYDKLALQFFVSPDIPFSSIHSSNKDYEKFLKDNISMKLSYTVGASVSFAVNKRIALSAGIQYSRANETVSGFDSVMNTYKRSNHLSFINMPLTVSYKTKWTKAFQTLLKAGILLNVSSTYKGYMPDEYGHFTDISNNVYESNTATSIYTAINFSKPFTKSLEVFAEPYFRWQTKNMANDIQPFTRKISTAGLALGIQWRLYKDEDK